MIFIGLESRTACKHLRAIEARFLHKVEMTDEFTDHRSQFTIIGVELVGLRSFGKPQDDR